MGDGIADVLKAQAISTIHDQLLRMAKLPGPLSLRPVR
jgi:hypothetical protein